MASDSCGNANLGCQQGRRNRGQGLCWLMVVFSPEARATPIIDILWQYLSAIEMAVAAGVGGHSIAWAPKASLRTLQLWLW